MPALRLPPWRAHLRAALDQPRAAQVKRGFVVSVLVAGLALMSLGVVTSVIDGRNQEQAALDHELDIEVGEKADALNNYFERARTVALIMARDAAFTDFYTTPGSVKAKIAAGGPLTQRPNQALAYLETLYPGRIGEACLIDRSGAEVARVVHGVPAAAVDLSPDESTNPFFAPTVALQPHGSDGSVYQARAYISPDTHEWVISNSTMLPAPAAGRAMVHFEITLDSFRTLGQQVEHSDAMSIVDARTGDIWIDTRSPQTIGAPLGRPNDHSLQGLVRAAGESGTTTLGDRRVSYRRLNSAPGNANTWYVVVSAPALHTGWAGGFGVTPIAMMLTALLSIAMGALSVRSHQRRLRHSAMHDSLTGLPNHAALTARLSTALPAAIRTGGSVAVLLVDLDRFKEVNDTVGHHLGDELLRQVAARLIAAVRSTDVVARFGADEFAVLMTEVHDVPAVQDVADRLLRALHDSFVLDGVTVDVEASVGLAVAPLHAGEVDALLRCTDAAMHRAKEVKNGWVLYDPESQGQAPSRLVLLGDLRRALDAEQQLQLHYQPKVDLATGRLVGVEALARWQHPSRGMVMPGDFIAVAEGTGLIQRLTTHVLELALTQAACWRAQGLHIPIAVNLSTRCLLDTTFPAKVFDLLDLHRLPTSVLDLEITESSIMADPARALTVLRALHDGGLRLGLDDFGTGYSSMAYLKDLPVDELKVDRSFVSELTTDRDNAVLVRSAIDLGHNLGLVVVAEGVEDVETEDALRLLGCDTAQGYFLGRPMSSANFSDWLAARPLMVTHCTLRITAVAAGAGR